MSKAMQYYLSKGCLSLKGSSETAQFTEYWNNLFDNFNRTLPWQGLKLNSDGFQVKLKGLNSVCLFYGTTIIPNT